MHRTTRRNWMEHAAAGGLALGWAAPRAQAAAAADLRITKTEAFQVRIPYAAAVRENMLENYRRENMDRPAYFTWIVKVHTAAGLVGVGEGGPMDPRGRLPGMEGRSVYELLHDVSAGPAAAIALYDVLAQAMGVPVCRLFSPNPRPVIRQIWWSHCLRPKLLQAEVRRGLAAGYAVHKIKARPYEDPAEQMAAVAEAAPHDYSVLFDANGSFESPGKTLAVAKSLERFFQVKGMEQPIAHENIVGYRRIRAALPLRLAVHWEGVDARAFVREALVDAFVVEDWQWGQPLMKKAAVCQLSGQKLWVENGLNSGISQVFQAHMAAACEPVEYTISLTHVAEDDLVVEPFTVEKGGFYKVPTGPGLGVALDEKAAQKYRVA